jgi:hypothetical protein
MIWKLIKLINLINSLTHCEQIKLLLLEVNFRVSVLDARGFLQAPRSFPRSFPRCIL